jgi:hypothetical protein
VDLLATCNNKFSKRISSYSSHTSSTFVHIILDMDVYFFVIPSSRIPSFSLLPFFLDLQ